MIAFGQPTWMDEVLDAIEARIALVSGLPRERVFTFAGEADALLGSPPAEQFVACWFSSLPPIAGIVAGGGVAHTAFDSVLRLDVFVRLGTDREMTDIRLLRDRSKGMAALVKKVLTAVQVWTGSADGMTSPFIESPRLSSGGITLNPRKPATGWAWARLNLNVKWRADLSPSPALPDPPPAPENALAWMDGDYLLWD